MEKVKIYAKDENELREKIRHDYGKNFDFEVLEEGEERAFLKKKKYYIVEIKEKTKKEEPKLEPNPYVEFEIDENEGIGYVKIKETDIFPSFEDIINTLNYYKNPYKVDENKVRKIIETRKFNEKFPVSFKKDASVKVLLEKGEIEAYIIVEPPYGGKDIEKEDIMRAIEEKKIIYGIKNENIEKILNEKLYNEKVLIAQGDEPLNGEDAKIIYHFKTDTGYEIKEGDFGRVDFREIGFIQTVKKGTILAEKIPPTEGKPGKTVTGKIIQQKHGKNIKLNATKGVILSEDGLKVIAEIDGSPFLKGNTVGVQPILVIEKVDFSIGNLNFDGSIKILKDVLPGFKIYAKGNIEIGGLAEECEINCEGDLIIKVGINNKDKYKVKCDGIFKCSYIQNTEVYCGKDIEAEMIINSKVHAKGKIKVKHGKGVIWGGEVYAAEGIECRELGSHFGAYTQVSVGFSGLVSDRIKELQKLIRESEIRLEEASKNIEYLKSQGINDERLNKYVYEEIHMKLRIKSFEEKIKEETKEMESLKHASIIVEVKSYPNVNITINGVNFKIEEELGPCRFYEKEGIIELGVI
jgi:uncharacterized protein (DUF342 family)